MYRTLDVTANVLLLSWGHGRALGKQTQWQNQDMARIQSTTTTTTTQWLSNDRINKRTAGWLVLWDEESALVFMPRRWTLLGFGDEASLHVRIFLEYFFLLSLAWKTSRSNRERVLVNKDERCVFAQCVMNPSGYCSRQRCLIHLQQPTWIYAYTHTQRGPHTRAYTHTRAHTGAHTHTYKFTPTHTHPGTHTLTSSLPMQCHRWWALWSEPEPSGFPLSVLWSVVSSSRVAIMVSAWAE